MASFTLRHATPAHIIKIPASEREAVLAEEICMPSFLRTATPA